MMIIFKRQSEKAKKYTLKPTNAAAVLYLSYHDGYDKTEI